MSEHARPEHNHLFFFFVPTSPSIYYSLVCMSECTYDNRQLREAVFHLPAVEIICARGVDLECVNPSPEMHFFFQVLLCDIQVATVHLHNVITILPQHL